MAGPYLEKQKDARSSRCFTIAPSRNPRLFRSALKTTSFSSPVPSLVTRAHTSPSVQLLRKQPSRRASYPASWSLSRAWIDQLTGTESSQVGEDSMGDTAPYYMLQGGFLDVTDAIGIVVLRCGCWFGRDDKQIVTERCRRSCRFFLFCFRVLLSFQCGRLFIIIMIRDATPSCGCCSNPFFVPASSADGSWLFPPVVASGGGGGAAAAGGRVSCVASSSSPSFMVLRRGSGSIQGAALASLLPALPVSPCSSCSTESAARDLQSNYNACSVSWNRAGAIGTYHYRPLHHLRKLRRRPTSSKVLIEDPANCQACTIQAEAQFTPYPVHC